MLVVKWWSLISKVVDLDIRIFVIINLLSLCDLEGSDDKCGKLSRLILLIIIKIANIVRV